MLDFIIGLVIGVVLGVVVMAHFAVYAIRDRAEREAQKKVAL